MKRWAMGGFFNIFSYITVGWHNVVSFGDASKKEGILSFLI
jgi:hypothetical protein